MRRVRKKIPSINNATFNLLRAPKLLPLIIINDLFKLKQNKTNNPPPQITKLLQFWAKEHTWQNKQKKGIKVTKLNDFLEKNISIQEGNKFWRLVRIKMKKSLLKRNNLSVNW